MKQKLKSRSGVSMLLALLFLFFALSVGAVVLTAASANAGRAARLRQEQQDYFAVQSAARLLRDDLQTLAFSGSYTETNSETTTYTDNEDGTSDSHTSHSGPYYSAPTVKATDAKLAALLQNDLRLQFAAGIPGHADFVQSVHTLEIALPEEAAIPAVSATVTLKENYQIRAELRLADSGANLMTLTLLGKENKSRSTERFYSSTDDSSTTETVTTYTSKVTFAPGEIVKGAAS